MSVSKMFGSEFYVSALNDYRSEIDKKAKVSAELSASGTCKHMYVVSD